MICAINLCQDTTLCECIKIKPSFLPFDETNLCNDYIFMDPKYIDRFCHRFPNQVDLNPNMINNAFLTKVVVRSTEKPRSVGPHKSKLKKTMNKKKSCIKNKKFRSVSTQLRRGSVEPSSGGKNILQQRIFYTNKDLKIYLFIDVCTSIQFFNWKLKKNCSHIISNIPLSGCLSYSGDN